MLKAKHEQTNAESSFRVWMMEDIGTLIHRKNNILNTAILPTYKLKWLTLEEHQRTMGNIQGESTEYSTQGEDSVR
jgi:hypothetical protein